MSRRVKTAVWAVLGMLLLTGATLSGKMNEKDQTIRVLVVTGGHEYDEENFDRMLASFTEVVFQKTMHPQANEVLESDSIQNYQVLLFYDMNQEISETQKAAFLELTERGTGLVFLHHSLASYQEWSDFQRIRGGRYDLDTSAYDYKQTVPLHLANPSHPVTRGLQDWTQTEETYSRFYLEPGVEPLLTTPHLKSDPVVGWTLQYQNSRVVYLQPGHDNNAFSNSNYRQLLHQAIFWAANEPIRSITPK